MKQPNGQHDLKKEQKISQNKVGALALAFFLMALLLNSCRQERHIDEYLEQIPQAQWTQGTIEVHFKQPVDHNHPGGDKFTQRVVINHLDYERPVVVMLEGYDLHSKKRSELARLLDANQVTIEHRFFAESTPQPPAWEHLTIWQAATDHHKIINTLKKLYPGKWITTGLSKGGQAVMFHKRFYPDDADASLAYVAPLLFSPEDKRVHDFLDQVGSDECRAKIRRFQKHLLKNRKSFMPLFETYAMEKDYHFPMGLERAFELIVLEYPFAFWQWSEAICSQIPSPDDPPGDQFEYLVQISPPTLFENQWVADKRAFFYQALTQTGMYSYRTKPFRPYLSDTSSITFDFALADTMKADFDPSAMQDIRNWLHKRGNNMIYLYGEQDPWTSAAFEPSEKTNAIKLVNPQGNHKLQITRLPWAMQDSIFTTLEDWLDIDIEP